MHRQIIMKRISPKTLFQLYTSLLSVKEIYDTVSQDSTIYEYLLFKSEKTTRSDKHNKNININISCSHIISFLEKTVDIILCKEIEGYSQFDTNFIKRGVNPLLDEKTETLMESQDHLEAIRIYFNKEISKYEKSSKTKDLGAATDYVKFHETEKNNISFVSTKRRCTLLKQCFAKFTDEITIPLEYQSSFNGEKKVYEFIVSKNSLESIPQTASNDSIITPQIKQLCTTISTIKTHMKDVLTHTYTKSVIEPIEQFDTDINNIIDFVTTTDIMYTKAYIAKKYHYCKPEIKENNEKKEIMPYKINSYKRAIEQLEKRKEPIYSIENAKHIEYVGKSFLEKINEIIETGTLQQWKNIDQKKELRYSIANDSFYYVDDITFNINKKGLIIKNGSCSCTTNNCQSCTLIISIYWY
jgi:hypothetical protein